MYIHMTPALSSQDQSGHLFSVACCAEFQSSRDVNKATPRLVQCAAGTAEGSLTSMTKLVL